MRGQVQLQRGQRDCASRHGMKIGSWPSILSGTDATHPIYRFASRILAANHRFGMVTPAQPGYLPGLGRSVTAGLTYRF